MRSNVYLFNVHHGDAIVVEYIIKEKSHWLVIDSKRVDRNGSSINPILEFLKKREVKFIDAVVITHFHVDHYLGMDEILYSFDIGLVFIPPFLSSNEEIFNLQINRLSEKIEELIKRSSDEEIGRRAYCLANIIKYLVENEEKVREATGAEQLFRLPFSEDPLGKFYLPLKKIKGNLIQIINSGQFELDTFANMNEASVVLELIFNNNHFIFGADSTKEQWIEHKRRFSGQGVSNLHATFLKAPHHGSKHNNSLNLYKYLLDNNSENNLFISANGKSHPDDEIFEIINELKLNPYCTSIAKQCLPKGIYDISTISKIPKEFRAFLTSYDVEDLPAPCQGDITIEFNDDSAKVYNSTGNSCPYRNTDIKIKKLI